MPGILPMKVIKVGSSSQSRIAQACDRCRSKKIRCDGIRPCCSQCANVGFECRTSDKLSRRAFPRGYTESLEERVRQLEAETRELKDLLDEKDEKIDMLSKMHSNQRRSSIASHMSSSPRTTSAQSPLSPTSNAVKLDAARHSTSLSPAPIPEAAETGPTTARANSAQRKPSEASIPERSSVGPTGTAASQASKRDSRSPTAPPAKEDTFRVQASPLLLGVENSDSYFMGASSGRSFIETFKRKMQENGKSCSDFHAEAFLHIQGCYPLVEKIPTGTMRIPPRMFSDRCVNVYFQEWSPLFPVLHRPAFLRTYDEFVSDPDKVKNHHKLAQLYLVFAIAALSSDQPDLEQIAICEQQWHRSLEAVLMDNTILTLQCLVLALLYCTVRADYKRLQYYKGIAVGLSHRLGLHQSQKRFSFGALTIETRKKVFWTLYTLDCFSAAVLGLPKMLKDNDIHAEYPSDTDDEYVTEKGFQPTLPGEFTRMSSALALFRASRILAKVLDTNYPAAATHELSLQQMSALEAELVEWRDTLPAHLTLTFRQEKPSTDVTGNRSPLLSLTYYYIRTLIWRPAVGTSLGAKAGSAVMAISEAAKYMIQIVELLEERKMSFSLCMNKPDLLVVCGMTLLYQSMDLKQDSKMLKDSERLINSVLKMSETAKAPGCYDLKRVANMLITLDEPLSPAPNAAEQEVPVGPTARRASSTGGRQKKIQQQPQQLGVGMLSSASVSESDLLHHQERLRRMTLPATTTAGALIKTEPQPYRSRSRSSFDNPREPQPKQHRMSMSQAQMLSRAVRPQQQQQTQQAQQRLSQKKNVDYLALGATAASLPSRSQPSSPMQNRQTQQQQQQFYGSVSNQKAASGVTTADWEALLGSMDGGQMNVYDAIYGGPAIGLNNTDTTPASAPSQSGEGWSPESWDLTGFSLGDLAGPESNSSGPGSIPPAAQSVLSFSDESMSSVGEDMTSTELASLGLGGLDIGSLDYRGANGLLNNGCGPGTDGFVIDSMESGFVL